MKRTLVVLALASFGLMAAPKPPKTTGTTDTTQTTQKHKVKKHVENPATQTPAETAPPVKKK